MSVVPPFARRIPYSAIASRQRIGLVSTYPPKICGLATFAAALEVGLIEAGHRVDVVRIDEGDDPATIERPVAAELVHGKPASIRKAAAVLSRCDVAVIQHEYGIYGGADGEEVVDLLRAIEVPTIVVLHTVPLAPTPHQRSLPAALRRCDSSSRIWRRVAGARTALPRSMPHGAPLSRTFAIRGRAS